MKFLVALFAVVACAAAGYAPLAYSAYGYAPAAYAASPYYAHGAYAAPLAYAAAPVVHHAAPVVHAAPAGGYVAQTRGSLHVAPHPEGPFTASHHINTAPAPGTHY